MLLALLGIIVGVVIGFQIPLGFTSVYTIYMSVALLAAFDSIFGAVRANLEGNFDAVIFVSGLILNTILAGVLAYIGDNLGIPLYYAAIFAFGVRLFNNFAIIRRHFIKKIRRKLYKNKGN